MEFRYIAMTVCTATMGALVPAPLLAIDEGENQILRIVGAYVRVGVKTNDEAFMLDSKVDTGADSTSIDAREIERFERDGEDWVRFEVPLEDSDESMLLEVEVEDEIRIVSSSGENERPVVLLDLCVGDLLMTTEVNLADRSGLDYRLLLGRGYLVRGGFLVNPGQAGEVDPRCAGFSDNEE